MSKPRPARRNVQVEEEAIDVFLAWSLRAIKLVVLGLVFWGVVSFYRHPLDRQEAMASEIAALRERHDELRAERDRLKRREKWIATDDDFLEREVRDRRHVHLEGEYILRFQD
jgi:hypothetical protein